MSVDTSTLGIKVTSTGIGPATTALNKLAVAADKAEKSTQAFSSANNSSVSSAASATGAIKAQTSATNQANAALAKLNGTTSTGASSTTKATASGRMFTSVLRSMATAASAYTGINLAKNVIEAGDSWQNMQARLKLATSSMESAKIVQTELYEMSQRIRVPLADVTRLYTRMADPLRTLGKTSKETSEMVESVALALQLSGATGAEASSVMLQFSQSVGAGRLNGAEFNAVAEGAPIILKALEIQTGKTRGELKKMGADGLISVKLLQEALAGQSEAWKRDFASLPITVDGAMQRVKNAWLKAIGEMSQETGLNKSLAEAVLKLEDAMPKIAEIIVKTMTLVIDNIKALTFAAEVLLSLKVVSWFTSAAAAMATAAGGATAAATATGALRVAFIALGWAGPVGIAIAVIGALYTAYKLWADNTPSQQAKVTQSVVEQADVRINAIRKEIDAINAKYAAESKGKKLEPEAKADPALAKFEENILRLTDAQIRADGEAAKQAFQIAIDKQKAKRDELVGITNVHAALKAADEQAQKKAEKDKQYGDWKDKHLSQEEKREKDLQAVRDMGLSKEQEADAIRRVNAEYSKKSAAAVTSSLKAQEKAEDAITVALKEQEMIKARLDANQPDFETLTSNEKTLLKLTQALTSAKDASVKSEIEANIVRAQGVVDLEKTNKLLREAKENEIALGVAKATQNADLAKISGQNGREIADYTLGSKAKAELDKIRAIEQKYTDQREELDKANQQKAISNYQEQLALIQSGQSKELEMYRAHTEAKKALDADWRTGASQAWEQYKEDAKSTAELSKEVFTNAFQGLEDALVNFVTTGKLSFSDLARSIIADLAKMAAKAAVSGLFNMILTAGVGMMGGGLGAVGGAGASAGTGMGSSIAGGGTMFAANGAVFSAGQSVSKFAKGSAFSNGVVNTPTNFDIGQMGEAGPEAIVPLTKTADGSLGIRQIGGDGESKSESIQVTYSPTIQIDARADKAEVEKIVQKAVQQGNAKLVDDLQRARRLG